MYIFLSLKEKMDEIQRELKITELELKKDKERADKDKKQFINDIKHNFGEQIKKNPNAVEIAKTSFYIKLISPIKQAFINFFNKF